MLSRDVYDMNRKKKRNKIMWTIIIGLIVILSIAIPIGINYNKGKVIIDGFDEYKFHKTLNLDTLTASKDGYAFKGFVDKDGNKVEKVSASGLGTKITIYPVFEPITYKINYSNQGLDADIIVDNQNVNTYTIENEIVLQEPSVAGYDFLGFYVNDEKLEKISAGTFGELNIVAKFSPERFYISYNIEGVSDSFKNSIKGTKIESYTIEDSVILSPLTNDGYTFLGYFNENNNEVTSIPVGSTGNKQLVAKFQPIEYTITYDNSDIPEAYRQTQNKLKTKYTIEDEFNLTSLTNNGYNFDGYYMDNEKISNITQGNFRNLDIELRWDPVVYEISYEIDNVLDKFKSTIKGNKVNSYTIEDTFSLTQLSNDGYTFLGYTDKLGTPVTTIVAGSTENKTFIAKFQPIEYTITYDNEDIPEAYRQLQNKLKTTYTIEDEFNLTSLTNNGYNFDGYYMDNEKISNITQGNFRNLDIELRWDPIVYEISYEIDNVLDKFKSTIKGNKVNSYTIEDTFSLTQLSNDGYTFLGYTDKLGTPVTTIIAGSTENKTFIAKFQPIEYTITYDNSDIPEAYRQTQNKLKTTYTIEDEFNLTSLTNNGYNFDGYYMDNEKISNITQGNFKNLDIELRWDPVVYEISYEIDNVLDKFKSTIKGNKVKTYTIEDTFSLTQLSNDGYTFLGYTDKLGTPVTTIVAGSTEDKTFIAKFQPIEYTITYDNEDIPEAYRQIQNKLKTTYTIEDEFNLTSLTNNGYNFDGYYMDNEKISNITQGNFRNLDIELRWDPVVYEISYEIDNVLDKFVSTIKGNKVKTYTIEDNIVLSNLTNDGYSFIGYFNEGDEQIATIVAGSTGNKTFIAKFQPIEYSITYDNSDIPEAYRQTQNKLKTTYTIEDEFNLTSLTNNGYNFDGYYMDNEKISNITQGNFRNLDIELRWDPIVYNINYSNNYKLAVNNNPQTYTIEDSIDFSDLILDKYQFVDWKNDNGVVVSKILAGSQGDVSLNASWSMVGEGSILNPYKIYNEDQLKNLFYEMDKYYELQNNIEVSYEWSPIGKSTTPFKGVFDGKGYKLTFNQIADNIDEFAMFGYIHEDGVVKNVKVSATQGTWVEEFYCNAFAGIALYNNGLIDSCTNLISIHTYTDYEQNKRYSLSGICYFNYGKITNCRNEGFLKVTSGQVAYIAGIACTNSSSSAVITDCYSTQYLMATAEKYVYIGRFVTFMENNAILRVSESKWDLEDNTELTDIIGNTTTTTDPNFKTKFIKEVAINNNYQVTAVECENDGYVYWQFLYWNEEHPETGIMYLESWYKGADENTYILNKSGEWELLSAENGYGQFLTRKDGGYAYGYNEQGIEV